MRFIYYPFLAFFFVIASFNHAFSQNYNKIDESLASYKNSPNRVSCIILMKTQANLAFAGNLKTKTEKGSLVFQKLSETAAYSQTEILNYLRAAHAGSIRSFFIINAVAAQLNWQQISELSTRGDVRKIVYDAAIKLREISVESYTPSFQRELTPTYGISMIEADKVWELGYRGQGIVIGGNDTGFDWLHPAIQSKYRGWDGTEAHHSYNWHDAIHEINPINYGPDSLPTDNPCGINITAPCDDNSHGTHTMGTMVGSDDGTTIIGVAPDAKWIGVRNMERGWGSVSTYLESFQWFLAPTDINNENPKPELAPHIINNSWYCSPQEGCSEANFEVYRFAVSALRAAGIVVVVAAGNDGECNKINYIPDLFEESFTIGATGMTDSIANFSSKGPVTADSSMRIKPDVSAPGRGVFSCIPGGGYAFYSGTSMASPHAAGVVALLLSARPELIGHVEEIEDILEETAIRKTADLDCLGFSGYDIPNPVYGWGRLDIYEAVKKAISTDDVFVNNDKISVYPNAFSDILHINISQTKNDYEMYIYTSTGQPVSHLSLLSADNSINTAHWPTGLYFYQVKSKKGTFTGKLVKVN